MASNNVIIKQKQKLSGRRQGWFINKNKKKSDQF